MFSSNALHDLPAFAIIFYFFKYTVASFRENGIKALKGVDNNRAGLLINANSNLDEKDQLVFYIVDANLVIESNDVAANRNESYEESCDENDLDSGRNCKENTQYTKIKEWYHSNGTPILNKNHKRIDVDFFTKIIDPNTELDKPFMNAKEEREWAKTCLTRHVNVHDSKQRRTDAAMNKKTTYSKYLLVFWPKQNEFKVLCEMDKMSALNALHASLDTDFQKKSFLNALVYVMDFFKNDKEDSCIWSDADKTKLFLTILAKIDNWPLTLSYLQSMHRLPSVDALAQLFCVYKWENLQSTIFKLLKPVTIVNVSNHCGLVKVKLQSTQKIF